MKEEFPKLEVETSREREIEKEREKLRELMPECLEKLRGWRQMSFTYEAHPYLNKAYALIYAAIKVELGSLDKKKILEIGFGSLVSMLQELAQHGAECYGIDHDNDVPYFIQKKKLSPEEAQESIFRMDMDKDEEIADREKFYYPSTTHFMKKAGWKEVPTLEGSGKVFYDHKQLKDLDELFEENKLNTIFANELFELGSYYLPSGAEEFDKKSVEMLSMIYKKLTPGGVFISRTMYSHLFKESHLKEAGFDVKFYNLPIKDLTRRKEGDRSPFEDEEFGGYLVICRKPEEKKAEENIK